MFITQCYKYKYNGIVYVGGEVPEGAEILETMDILNAEEGFDLIRIADEKITERKKVLNRFLLISLIIAIATAVFFKLQSDNRLLRATNAENQNNALQTEIKGYKNAIQKYNDAQDRAGEKIEKVQTIVRTVKSDCDCYNTLLPDGVRKILRED